MNAPTRKPRVAVVFGGRSSEHAISCVTAAILAILATWGLSFYFLGTLASVSWTPIVIIGMIVTGATVLAGVIGCWGMFGRSTLEAFRLEA